MESRIAENPWPARKVILKTILFGYVMVTVVMAYMYYTRHVGRLAPPFLVSAIITAACFALLFVAISLVIRPNGNWSVSDEGLHFRDASANLEWQIPWVAISRMKYTSVTLVIWWTEAPDKSIGRPQLHRDVLYIHKGQASDLIATWHCHPKTPTTLTHSHSEHGR